MDEIVTKEINGAVINILPYNITIPRFKSFIADNMKDWGTRHVIWDARTLKHINYEMLHSPDFRETLQGVKIHNRDKKFAIVVKGGGQIIEMIKLLEKLREYGLAMNTECFEHLDSALEWIFQ